MNLISHLSIRRIQDSKKVSHLKISRTVKLMPRLNGSHRIEVMDKLGGNHELIGRSSLQKDRRLGG